MTGAPKHTPEEEAGIRHAMAVMAAHVEALNAGDEEALASTLHFPHYRLSGGILRIWDNPASYLRDFRKRAGDDWGYSAWGPIEVIAASPDKVHLAVVVDRFRPDGTLLTRFHSMWAIAKIGDVWAAQLRSSFAPDRGGDPPGIGS